MGISKVITKSNIHLKTAWLYIVADSSVKPKEFHARVSGSGSNLQLYSDHTPTSIPIAESETLYSFRMDWAEYSNIKLNKLMFDVTLKGSDDKVYVFENNLIS